MKDMPPQAPLLSSPESEEALRRANTYTRGLIDASLDPLVTIGPDGKITDVNTATEEVTGRPRADLIGTDFCCYFTEPEKAKDGYERVFRDGQVRDYPLEIKGKDGRVTPVLYNATVYRDAAGAVAGVFAAARDISGQKVAEEEIARNLARQKALLELYQKKADAPIPDIISFVVENCVALTESALGFVGLISRDGLTMEAHLWSEKAMAGCEIDKPVMFPIQEAGIWAEPIRQRMPIIINDYRAPHPLKKGYPRGHLELTRFLGVPVLDGNRVMAVAGVANKRDEYTQTEQNKVSLLIEGMWDLIKRRNAEESLRRSEARLHEAQRIGQIGHWELDLVNNVLFWSDEIYRIFEIAPARFGASYDAFLAAIHPDDRAAVDAAYTGSFKTHVPYAIDHRLLFPDGRIKFVHEQCETTYAPDGTPLRSLGTVQDVTIRKRMEDDLRRAVAYNRSLIEASLDPLVTIGPDGKITDVNAATEKITGRMRRELIGTDFSEYFTDPESARQGYRQAFREGTVRNYPLKIRRTDGSSVAVLYNATVYRDEAGAVIGVFAAARDVTELMSAETALRDSEQRYKRLVESVTDYIYTVRVENGRPVATQHGPGCVSVTGYRDDEYAADPYLWYRMIYQEDQGAVKAQADSLLAGTSVWPLEHRIMHKNGALRWVRNTPVPRYNEQGSLVSYDGLISDITERKRLEEQLRHAQKMEAIGQLAGGVAHDFNNILSAIIGYGHILQIKMNESDPLRMNVQHLLEAADRAAHLTHSLLAFSRKQIINLADVELNEIIRRIEKFLRRIIGEDIELRTVLKKDRITVHADSGQLEQIFMNLAANARDAMDRGGRLTIESDVVELDDTFVRAHGYGRQGKFAVIMVSDTGAGMDNEVLKRVFEPFFSTKEPGKGTGLGLAVVYGIVKQHNGFISVYSEPGRGTTFRIYLPFVAQTAGAAAGAALTSTREIPGGSETLLVAEDDETVRKLTVSVLSEFGYTVIEAANGREAVDAFLRNADRISMIILDMIMPKMNGREVYAEIRKERRDIKAIFVTGYTADKIFTEGLLARGAEVLLKPLSPRTLLEKVRQVLDKA